MAKDRVSVVVPFGQEGLTFTFSSSSILSAVASTMEGNTFDATGALAVLGIAAVGDAPAQRNMVIDIIDEFRVNELPFDDDLFWRAMIMGIVGGEK